MTAHAACLPSSAPCVIWTKARDTHGRAQVFRNGKRRQLHRIVCEQTNGPPPTPEHEAGHLCQNGRGGCVAPYHLRWMTRAENAAMRTDQRKGRKITEDAARKIRTLKTAGYRTRDIARCFSVSDRLVNQIGNGERWWWL